MVHVEQDASRARVATLANPGCRPLDVLGVLEAVDLVEALETALDREHAPVKKPAGRRGRLIKDRLVLPALDASLAEAGELAVRATAPGERGGHDLPVERRSLHQRR